MNNYGVIFRRAIRDSRNGILGWGIALGLLVFIEVLIFPTMTAFEGFADFLESPFYKAMLGELAEGASFTTPEGFIAIYVITLTPLYLAVYIVLQALGMTAGEEDRGTIDVLLSTPIPRWQIIVEKFLALIVIVVGIFAIMFVGMFVGIIITPEMEISFLRLVEGVFSMVPVMLVIGGVALVLSTILRSRGMAGGITGAIIITSYMINTMSDLAPESIGQIQPLSMFHYLKGSYILLDGMRWGDFFLLTVVAFALMGVSLYFFQRRDLAV